MNKLSIKEWAEDDRPREKVLRQGISSLSNVELLAILIGSGSGKESAVQLAQRILSSVDNNLCSFGKLSLDDLISNFTGIGIAKGVTILAALEFGKRRMAAEPIVRDIIHSSKDVFEIFHPLLSDLPHEEFWVIFLNRSNRIIEKRRLSQGGVSGTVVDVKLLLKAALNVLAAGIVLCHNHPSGNFQPSQADDLLTTRIVKAAKLLDMQVLDHVIVSDNRYYSYADQGRLCDIG